MSVRLSLIIVGLISSIFLLPTQAKSRQLERRLLQTPLLTSYFTGTDLDDWTVNYGVLTNPGSDGYGGGNNNGYIRTTAPGDGRTSYYVAPPKYLGDWQDYSEIRLALWSSGGNYYSSGYRSYGDLYLANGSMSARLLLPERPPTSWTEYAISLNDTEDWVLEGGATSLEAVLSNVTSFQIRAEYGVGSDSSGLDNVELFDFGSSTITPAPPRTSTPTPTFTPTSTPTKTPTSTPTKTPTKIPTSTRTPTATRTGTPAPAPTATPVASPPAGCCCVIVALGGACDGGKSLILFQTADLVELYRRFRDETLETTLTGQKYIEIYDENTGELAGILLTNPELRNRTGQFLDNASDAFASLLPDATTSAVLDQALYDEANALVQDLAAAGSAEFGENMLQVWAELALDQQIGKQTTLIWEDIQRSTIYLPVIVK